VAYPIYMSGRADEAALPNPLRWLGAAALSALIATTLLKLRDRKKAAQPSVSPMSDEWLRHHNASRRSDY